MHGEFISGLIIDLTITVKEANGGVTFLRFACFFHDVPEASYTLSRKNFYCSVVAGVHIYIKQ